MTTPVQVERLLKNVPAELQAMAHWVVWVPVQGVDKNGDPKILKEPRRSRDPSLNASTRQPTTWGTFEEAIEACRQFPTAVGGIGFVFTHDCGYVGIDVDNLTRVLAEHLIDRKRFEERLDEKLLTYCERSPSGHGKHFILKAELSGTNGSPKWTDIQMELYGWSCFLTFTGDVIDGKRKIKEEQAFLDTIKDLFGAGRSNRDGDEIVEDESVYRRTDLSDDEVIALAFASRPEVRARYEGLADCEPSMWTKTAFNSVVSELDKVSGSVEQIRKIVFASPMVTQSPPSNRKESRPAKARRLFESTLTRVRLGEHKLLKDEEQKLTWTDPLTRGNNEIVFGRWIAERLEQAKRDLQAEAFKLAGEAKAAASELSPYAAALLDAFPDLTTEHRILTRPPGRMGQFVEATEKACPNPFPKFAIPATLTTMSGILGRRYKLPDEQGLNINVLLMAPSAGGKTQSQTAVEGFVDQAIAGLPDTRSGPPRPRIINTETSSLQAMMPAFATSPSSVWFSEECGPQLKSMSDPRSIPGGILKAGINRLYDASRVFKPYNAPESIAGQTKRQVVPIKNANISIYWTTVPDSFEIRTSDFKDGFVSRFILVRHSGRCGQPNEHLDRRLGDELLDWLRQFIWAATELDEDYYVDRNQADILARIRQIEVPESVANLQLQFRNIAQGLLNAAHDEILPDVYTAVSRLLPIAMRIAGTMAVVDNPWYPVITEVQFKWAFGYLLQNVVSVLSAMDHGEIGEGASDDYKAVLRTMENMFGNPKFSFMKDGGIPSWQLVKALTRIKPFNEPRFLNTNESIEKTLKAMTNAHIIKSETTDTKGHKATRWQFDYEYNNQRRTK